MSPGPSKVAQDISAQQRILDSMEEISSRVGSVKPAAEIHVLTRPPLNFPPNPLVETNQRLENIEDQFEKISEVAREAAQVAVGLQAAAAEFLQKFEVAAADTNRSGTQAIKMGWLALAIAIVTAVAQIAAPLVLPNNDALVLQKEVAGLQSELEGLRIEQVDASKQIIAAISRGDSETALVIKDALAGLKSAIALLRSKAQ